MAGATDPTTPFLRPLAGPINLSHQVASRLRAAILNGLLPPGTRLVERDIARQLGISRMPVREAIQQLVEDGLLIKEPRRGAYVHPYSETDLEEIYSLRIVMEHFVAERAMERWSPNAAACLQTIVDAMASAAESGDTYKVYELDDQFHATLWQLAEHKLLLEIVVGLRTRISRFLLEATQLLSPDQLEHHVAAHQRILNTLQSGDIQAAKHEISRHILLAKDRIKNHYRYLNRSE